MEPLNNPDIPYIGSVMAPADFRLKIQQWLKDHDGYPIYKTSTLARPKIPQSFDVFAAAFFQFFDTYNSSANLNFDPNGTAGKNAGKPILDMINLYLKCKDASSADPTTTCGKIYNLEHNLFGPNLAKYMTYPCAVFNDLSAKSSRSPIRSPGACGRFTAGSPTILHSGMTRHSPLQRPSPAETRRAPPRSRAMLFSTPP